MNVKKALAMLTSVAMSLSLFAGPVNAASDGEKKVITLSMSVTEQQKADAEKAIARFEEKYPEYTVDADFAASSTWQELCDKLLVQVASGEAPNVVYTAIEGTRMMVSNGLFYSIDDLLASDPEGQNLKDEIPQAAWDAFTVDGKIYEMPYDANSILLHYNTKMYEEAGLAAPGDDYTWEQYVSDLQALTKGDGDNKVYGTMINPSYLWPYFLANGTSVLNEDWTKSNLKDPKVKETLQNLYDLIYKYEVAPVPETNDDAGNMFSAGRVATICMGMFYTATYEANNFTDFDMAIMPRGSEGGKGCFGIGGLGITTNCKYPEAAYNLCKEFASKEFEETQAKTGTSVPLIRSVAESDDFLSHAPHVFVHYTEIENGETMPCPANFSKMSSIITTMATNILTGAVDIDTAIEQADQELTASLDALQ